MASEMAIADAWIYGRLHGDSALVAAATAGIHNTWAPQGAAPPYVIFAFIGGAHQNAGAGTRIGSTLEYDVSGYTEGGSFALADTMANRIDAVLAVATAQTVLSGSTPVARISSIPIAPLGQVPNPTTGTRVNRRGHTVRVTVQRI